MFHYTVESKVDVQETIEVLTDNLKQENFGVLWDFGMKDKLEEKGIELEQEYQVLEVCNPAEAKKALDENQLVGYFLPCKIVVYEDQESGKTKIGLPKPTFLIEAVDEELTEFAQDIERRLIKSIDKTVDKK